MAFSFPPNPSNGQTYSNNGVTWQWNGLQWAPTKLPTNTEAPVYISVSPPGNPVTGSLWYDSNNASLNIYYSDLNGSQWISVNPGIESALTVNGGVLQGAIYAQYEIPNNAAAFVTKSWVENLVQTYLAEQGYMRSGDGVTIDSNTGRITSISDALIVPAP